MNSTDKQIKGVRAKWSSPDHPSPEPPVWRRWIDSFKPMEPGGRNGNPKANEAGNGMESALVAEDSGLKQTLKNRHIQMIAIGGVLGSDLFIGTGGLLATGGPASLLLGFILIGTMLFNVVMTLSEMAVLYPIAGSFSIYSARFIDQAWGFAMSWNYLLQWLVVLPLELTFATMTVQYWGGTMDSSVVITILLMSVIFINFFGVKGYGEAECVFSMMKVVALAGFIVLGVVIDVGGAPNGEYYGVKTWIDPGAFNNGFEGFCSVLVIAAFAFGGTEMVGLAAAESANPRKCIPKVTKQVFWRISIFYILSLFLIGLIVPFTHPRLLGNNQNTSSSHDATASPFVIAITDSGVKILPCIFNGVILLSSLSVANSAVYGSSRTLCALAQSGQAHRFLGYIDRKCRPLFAIILALLLGGLAYIVEAGTSSETIFGWLLAISGLATIFTWLSICWFHIRFRAAWKAQGHTLDELPFKAAFGVIGSYWGVFFNVLVLAAQFLVSVWPIPANGSECANPLVYYNGTEALIYVSGMAPLSTFNGTNHDGCGATAESFFHDYLAAPIVLVCFVVWKLWKKKKKKTPFMVVGKGNKRGFSLFHTETIDLVAGRRELDLSAILAEERAEHAKMPAWKRFHRSLCG